MWFQRKKIIKQDRIHANHKKSIWDLSTLIWNSLQTSHPQTVHWTSPRSSSPGALPPRCCWTASCHLTVSEQQVELCGQREREAAEWRGHRGECGGFHYTQTLMWAVKTWTRGTIKVCERPDYLAVWLAWPLEIACTGSAAVWALQCVGPGENTRGAVQGPVKPN